MNLLPLLFMLLMPRSGDSLRGCAAPVPVRPMSFIQWSADKTGTDRHLEGRYENYLAEWAARRR